MFPYDRYLERESTVEIKSVRDMCEWLLGCEYMPDQEFFNQSDLWQHPVDFETTRKGDCEDHSLWAWRKFYDMGIQAEFVVGKIQGKDQTEGDHTWIILKNGSEFHIMETTLKRMEQFFVPSSKANNLYRPIYGMNTKLRSFVYKKKVGLRS